MLNRTIFISFICISGFFCSAQTGIPEARTEMNLFNYSEAVVILQGEVKKGNDKSKRESGMLLADCYRLLNDVENAKICYAKVLGNDYTGVGSPVQPVAWYHYAQALRSCGQYPQAKKIFLHYDSLVPEDPRGKQFAAYCDSVLLWQSAKPAFNIRNVHPVNSPQSEFGIVFYRQGILFASDRAREDKTGKTYGWTGNNYLNLFYAGAYKNPQPAPEIADQAWHDGPVCFDRGFTEVFINRTQATHDRGKKDPDHVRTHLLKIFTSIRDGGKWSTPLPFFLNNDEYSVGHPALAPDGKTLYFVSDMKGGFGETDIYVCKRENGKWSEPFNLGDEVNTAGKEMFPFVADNGDLYFSSDGLPGFGGLDLFVTRNDGIGWTKPCNLGQPVNSSYDDFSGAISGTNGEGLFSSNRPGGMGSDDIYSFVKVPSVLPSPEPSVTPVASAVVSSPAMSIDTMVADKPYRLDNIFYDFDKWNIREDAKPPLDQLVALMKNHPVTIELGSHTDCRGSESYNMLLSQRRAESAIEYIISKGIDAGRIKAIGYGKSQPANSCNCSSGSECTEAEHQFNRRTEFRITHL